MFSTEYNHPERLPTADVGHPGEEEMENKVSESLGRFAIAIIARTGKMEIIGGKDGVRETRTPFPATILSARKDRKGQPFPPAAPTFQLAPRQSVRSDLSRGLREKSSRIIGGREGRRQS